MSGEPVSSLSPVKMFFPKDLPPITRTIDLFAVYAPADQELWNELEKHFTLLKRRGVINTWHAGQILPGYNIAREVEVYLNAAQIVLFLVSPDLFVDAFPLIERVMLKQGGEAVYVLPVLFRPVDWQDSPFGELKALPANGIPVVNWQSRDDALAQITQEIRKVVEEMLLHREERSHG